MSIVVAFCAVSEARYQLAPPQTSGSNGKSEFFDAYFFENTGNASFGFSIPLFSVTVPGYGREHPDLEQFRTVNFGNLALLGMVILGTITLTMPLFTSKPDWLSQPLSFLPGAGEVLRNRRDISFSNTENSFLSPRVIEDSAMEHVITWIDIVLTRVPPLIMKDGRECMKLFICKLNQRPKRYGFLGKIAKVVFPAQLMYDMNKRKNGTRLASDDIILSYANAALLGYLNRDDSTDTDTCMYKYYRGCWLATPH